MNWLITLLGLVPYFLGMLIGFFLGRDYEFNKNVNIDKWDQDAH